MILPTESLLICALTEFDRRAAKRKGYNVHALGHYCRAAADVSADVRAGRTWRAAILANFTGRLLDASLRGIGETPATDQEHRRAGGGPIELPTDCPECGRRAGDARGGCGPDCPAHSARDDFNGAPISP